MFRLLEKNWSADLAGELRPLQRQRNEHFQIICFFEHESDISDNEFLPDAKKKWNTEKYNHKINQLSKVFSIK